MILKLYWKDKKKNDYHLANLKKENDLYILDINERELKEAIKHGCYGIGNIDFLSNHYESKELFEFFKERIPSKDYPRINEFLKRYNLKEYDDMMLLSKTNGYTNNDRYYILGE